MRIWTKNDSKNISSQEFMLSGETVTGKILDKVQLLLKMLPGQLLPTSFISNFWLLDKKRKC